MYDENQQLSRTMPHDPNAQLKRPGRRIGQVANPNQDQPMAPHVMPGGPVGLQPQGGAPDRAQQMYQPQQAGGPAVMPNGKPMPYQAPAMQPGGPDRPMPMTRPGFDPRQAPQMPGIAVDPPMTQPQPGGNLFSPHGMPPPPAGGGGGNLFRSPQQQPPSGGMNPLQQAIQGGAPFQSNNRDGRGYLEEATRAYQSTLQGIKDEGERESAVEGYLKSLVPELQARGMNVGQVRKEKMQINGNWVDLYRDITNGRGSGAAEAQWSEEMPGTGGPDRAMPIRGPQTLNPLQMAVSGELNRTQPTGKPTIDGLGQPGVVDEGPGMRPPMMSDAPPFEEMGNNLVRFADGTVVPKDHPIFQERMKQAGGGRGGGPDRTMPIDPRQPAEPKPWGAINNPTYDPTVFDQFKAPDDGGNTDLQTQLLNKILTNPETMTPQAVAQLKERQKEEALGMQQQLEQRLTQNAVSRGVDGGGFSDATRRRLGDATTSSLLGSYRDIDLEKVGRDRQDQLGALGAAESVLSGQLGRASDSYRTQLAGQQSTADERYRQFQGDLQNRELALRKSLGESDIASRNRGLDLQRELGMGGLDMDRQRLGESGRQFDLGHQLALQQFLENSQQFKDQLGFNYGMFQHNAQMDPLKILMGMFPNG